MAHLAGSRGVLAVVQWPLEETRTANSGCLWIAEAKLHGATYTARERHGAPNALFRQLVEAGIVDAQAEVRMSGLRGSMKYASFHEAAKVTYTEGTGALWRIPYQDPQNAFAVVRGAVKRAMSAVPRLRPPEASRGEKDGVAA